MCAVLQTCPSQKLSCVVVSSGLQSLLTIRSKPTAMIIIHTAVHELCCIAPTSCISVNRAVSNCAVPCCCMKSVCYKLKSAARDLGMQAGLTRLSIGAACLDFVLLHVAVEMDAKNPQEEGNIGEAYRQLWQVMKLPAMQKFALVLLTFRSGIPTHTDVCFTKKSCRHCQYIVLAMRASLLEHFNVQQYDVHGALQVRHVAC